MKKIILKITALSILGILISCSPVKVVVDQDKTVDFTQYKTFSFLGWQEDSDQLLSAFDKKRMRDAFAAEFRARDLKYVEDGGDMDVSLFVVLNQKTSVTAYTDYYGTGGYGYRRYGGGWGYGSSTTTYSESDYTEGTLVMDVFDSSTKDQIWQGIATATVAEDPEKREKTIPKKIGALMDKFPVPAVK